MVCGTKPNNCINNKTVICMAKHGYLGLGLLLTIGSLHPIATAEVLQSLSDDTVNISIKAEEDEKPDRRFSYRVICSPEDEALPDCESSQDKAEENGRPTMVLPMPDLPIDAADRENDERQVAVQHPAKREKPRQKAIKAKTKKTSSKAAKKSAKKSVKKPAKK